MNDYIVFDGVDSRTFGVYLFDRGNDNAPERIYSRYEIPAKNGDLLIDEKRYENVIVQYDLIAFGAGLEGRVQKFKDFMKSRIGYKRLEDSFRPEEYYMACQAAEIEVAYDRERERCKIELTFDRQPQRFLKTGEKSVDANELKDIGTVTGDIAYCDGGDGNRLATITATGTEVTYCGKNIFDDDNANWKDGYLINNSGAEQANGSYKYTQAFIRVIPSMAYTLQLNKGASSAAVTVIFYDSTQTFISRQVVIPANTAEGHRSGQFTPPSNCAFIRLNAPKNNTTNVQVEYGDMETEYDEYSATVTEYTEPFTISLLKGGNHIWADSGEISAECKELSNKFVNPSYFDACPLIRVEGTGTVTIGSNTITISENDGYTDIDCQLMEAYKGSTSRNAYVSFSGFEPPSLKEGATIIGYSSGITSLKVIPRWWRL